ncbi:hypothetical protein FE392_08710 [Xenorhabdus sp. 12]|uniref:Uncharacterized protein n=1 Tax=Xenorhabdus santafensis TaxID=2582833 RepID=A0ABU4S9C5_9GAMM|nr:hypothetical protein [Xenorhabdus sp. 12]MDX7987409.1 hypothetical protein [Xenorhabdus sp. 12]
MIFFKRRKIKLTDVKSENLSTLCDPLLHKDLGVLDGSGVKNALFLSSINDTECQLEYNFNYIIRAILLSWLLGFTLAFGNFINDFMRTWEANEEIFLKLAKYAKEDFGEYFYLNENIPEHQKKYGYIAHDDSISFFKYLHIRYSKDGFYGEKNARKDLILDGSFFLFFFNDECHFNLFFI